MVKYQHMNRKIEKGKGIWSGWNSIYAKKQKSIKKRLHIALKAAKICVFEVDLKRQLYTFFENAEDIFGVPGEVILNDVKPFSQLPPDAYRKAVTEYFSHPDDNQVIEKAFQAIFSGKTATYEARMRAGGSDFLWCKIDVTPVIENKLPVKMIGVITDISGLKNKTDRLENEVKLDTFTGLYNKKYVIETIENLLEQDLGQRHALILLDIDHLKRLNDTRGHTLGDEAIQLVTAALKRSFRKTDVLGRFGGDEFIIFVRDIPSREWLVAKLEKLLRFESDVCSGTCSAGVAIFPEDAERFSPLFGKADQALYEAKLRRGSFAFFADGSRK